MQLTILVFFPLYKRLKMTMSSLIAQNLMSCITWSVKTHCLNAKHHCERCSLAQTITKRGNLPFVKGVTFFFYSCLVYGVCFLSLPKTHPMDAVIVVKETDQLSISLSPVLSSLIRGPLHHSPYCSRALRRGGCATPLDRLSTPFFRQVLTGAQRSCDLTRFFYELVSRRKSVGLKICVHTYLRL